MILEDHRTLVSVYCFKLLEYASIWAAAVFTEKLFSNTYMKQVYTNNKPPPNLFKMLGLFVGLNLLFTVIMLLFILLLYLLLGGTKEVSSDTGVAASAPSGVTPVPVTPSFLDKVKEFFKDGTEEHFSSNSYLFLFVIDYLSFTLVHTILLAIVVWYMQKKKYFRYQTEGLRAIRAFKDLILSFSNVLLPIPYFLAVQMMKREAVAVTVDEAAQEDLKKTIDILKEQLLETQRTNEASKIQDTQNQIETLKRLLEQSIASSKPTGSIPSTQIASSGS